VWGAQELSGKEVTMRLVAKTTPMRQWEVARELRARVKAALDAAGVQPAGPDTIVVSAPPAVTPAVARGAAAGGAPPAAAPQPEPAVVAVATAATAEDLETPAGGLETPAEDRLAATDFPPDDGASLNGR